MNKTHTPLEIDGKIWIVVDAPDVPSPLDIHFERKKRIYYSRLSTCTKYETLEQHAPYWKERIGQRVEVAFWSQPPVDAYDFDSNGYFLEEEYEQALLGYDGTEYAIPKRKLPPQKNLLVDTLIAATVGTQSQYDTIQAHMDEYFKRWPSYKGRLTELEWYHLFLDFSDKLAIPPQQKQGDEWEEAEKEYLKAAGVEKLPPPAFKLLTWLKQHNYNLTKK